MMTGAHILKQMPERDILYDKGGEALGQISCGWSVPGSVQGHVGLGFQHKTHYKPIL